MIIELAKLDPDVEVTAEVDAGDDFAAGLAKADAVIEFSHHTVTPAGGESLRGGGQDPGRRHDRA